MCPRFAAEGRRGWYFPARGNATVLGRSVAGAGTGGAGRQLPDGAEVVGEMNHAAHRFRHAVAIPRRPLLDRGRPRRRLAPERRPQRRPFVVGDREARPARGEVRVMPGILASGPPVEEAQSIADVIDMCRHRRAAVRTGARLCFRERIERVVQTAIAAVEEEGGLTRPREQLGEQPAERGAERSSVRRQDPPFFASCVSSSRMRE